MKQTDVTGIRRAENDELDLVRQLIDQKRPGFDLAHWRRQSALLGSFTYLVEQQNVFGFVSAGSAELPDSTVGEILGLWISPEFRRSNWGRKLLVSGLSVLKRRNFETAHVYLNPDSQPAKGLIRTLGFEPLEHGRWVNDADESIQQEGFQLSLTDYF